MHPAQPLILLTGFGPFPGTPVNASARLADTLASAAARALPGFAYRSAVLPTEWHAGPALLEDLLAQCRPALALHFGVSSRARGFEIETRGLNVCRHAVDARGAHADSARLVLGGQEALPASIPARLIVERLRRRGLPASLSRDAGGYLCNAVLYRSLLIARDAAAKPRVGFVHIPAGLLVDRPGARRAATAANSPLSWEDAVTGGLEILASALGRSVGASRR